MCVCYKGINELIIALILLKSIIYNKIKTTIVIQMNSSTKIVYNVHNKACHQRKNSVLYNVNHI